MRLDRSHVDCGEGSRIDPSADVGYAAGAGAGESPPLTRIGDGARIRAGTVVYAGVTIGDDFSTGHDALIREGTTVGDDVLVGTKTVVDGATEIDDHVSLQTRVYVPRETEIESNVFIGPGAVLTNDAYPIRTNDGLEGPTIAEGASIGANATILPGVRIGENAFVAAGAVVCEDVPANTLAVGAPARKRELPDRLAGPNQLA